MKKLLRILIIILCTIIFISSVIIVIAPKYLNTNSFKHHIESLLMNQIQRVVKIDDVSISLFPDINLHLSNISIGNAKGFASSPQIYIPSTSMYLEIWPLFKKRIVFKRIFLNKFKINLCQKKNSKNNWDDLLKVFLSKKDSSKNSVTKNFPKNSFSLLTLGNITFKDSEIQFDDRLNDNKINISHLTYQCAGLLRNIIHINCNISGLINHKNKKYSIDSHMELNGRATFHLKQRKYSINDADLKIDAKALLPDNKLIESHLDSKVAFSTYHGALELSDMKLIIDNMNINGDIFIRHLFDKPSVSGHINLNTNNILKNFFVYKEPIGFDGPFESEITFHAQGKNFSTFLNNLDLTMLIKTGEGKIVLPASDDYDFLEHEMPSFKKSKIKIHLTKPKNHNKNIHAEYSFKTNCEGVLDQVNSDLDIKFKTQAIITIDLFLSNILIENGEFSLTSNWKKIPGDYNIKGNIYGDIRKKELKLTNAIISGPDVDAKIELHLTYPEKQYSIKNHLDFKIKNIKKFLSAFSIKTPQFYNQDSFENINFKGDVKVTPKYIKMKKISLNIDDALLKGNVSVTNNPFVINLDLEVQDLNADNYWIKRTKIKNNQKVLKSSAQISKDKSASFFHPEINAKLDFKNLRYCNVFFDRFSTNLKGKNGFYRLSPTSAKLYGGEVSGHWTYDYSSKIPKATAVFHCKNIEIGHYLTDYIKFDRIFGKLEMKASLSSDLYGLRINKSTMNGNAKITLTNGTIKGILIVPTDVQKEIFEIHKKSNSSLGLKKQQFVNKISGFATFKNGVMHNSDLDVSAERLKINGKGSIDCAKWKVDYALIVRIGNLPAIPYQVKGLMHNPKASLNKSEFLKTAVSGFFNQAGSMGSVTLKDTIDIGGKALDMDMDPIHKTVNKSSKAIKETINKSSGTIKETIGVGTDAIKAGTEALKSLGNRFKGLFQREKKQKYDNKQDEDHKKSDDIK